VFFTRGCCCGGLVVVVVVVAVVVVFGVVAFTAPMWLSLRYGDGWDGVDSFGTFSWLRWCACDVDASPAVNEIDVEDEAKVEEETQQ
jgi:hypothetical protein